MNNNINQIELKKLTYMIQQELKTEGLNSDSSIDFERFFAHEIVCRLKYNLAAQSNTQRISKKFNQKVKHEIIVTTKYPTTLWQMFKEKHLPKFLLKKYPVKYKVFTTSVEKYIPVNFECEVGIDAVYPKITLPQDKFTINFRFMDGHNFTVPKTFIEE